MPYYTPSNPRQFSSSAAKRQSVLALGSIAHLQHYFVRNGLANNNRSSNHKNMVLALPGRDPDGLFEQDDQALQNLPPEPPPPPPMPNQPNFPQGRAAPDLTDLESARQEVMIQLDQLCKSWGLLELAATRAPSVASNRSADESLIPDLNQTKPSPPSSSSIRLPNPPSFQLLSLPPSFGHHQTFVVDLLTLTTRAVRSVQKFILTIPDPDIFNSSSNLGLGGDLERRMSHLVLSTAARPRISRSSLRMPSSRTSSPSRVDHSNPSSHPPVSFPFDPFALYKKRAASGSMINPPTSSVQNTTKDDPLSVLRRMSLKVLGCLKDIEHKFRIPGSATPMDNNDLSALQADERHSQLSGSSLPLSQTDSKSIEQDEDHSESSLSLPSMSWEYQQDIGLEDIREEALIVKQWLECVDGVLEGMKLMTGTRRKKVRQSHSDEPKRRKDKKKTSKTPKEQNVLKKIINSSKFNQSTHSTTTQTSRQRDLKVPEIISFDDTDHESSLSEFDEDDEDSEELLPDWARKDRFTTLKTLQGSQQQLAEDDQYARLFGCLIRHLPHELLLHLRSPHGDDGSRIEFLDSLSDGTLLCLVYNMVLRSSQRPWGFIPVETIHNLINPITTSPPPCSPTSPRFGDGPHPPPSMLKSPPIQEGPEHKDQNDCLTRSLSSYEAYAATSLITPPNSKVGLTFRRTENIKVWAAALKLRYMIKSEIPTVVNPSSSTDPTTAPNNTNGSIVTKFDPKVIARKSAGWDTMLEHMVFRWLDAIRAEKREEVLYSK